MRGTCMVNIILRTLTRLKNKNIYRKKAFPYDMRKAKEYALSVNKNLYELTEKEMSRFLIRQ